MLDRWGEETRVLNDELNLNDLIGPRLQGKQVRESHLHLAAKLQDGRQVLST